MAAAKKRLKVKKRAYTRRMDRGGADGGSGRTKRLKHIKLPNEVYDALSAIFATAPRKGAERHTPSLDFVRRIEPGQSELTASLSPLSFAKASYTLAKEGIKFDVRKGLFVAGEGVAPIRGIVVTRHS